MSSFDTGSIRAIAKKDFQDAVRSWLFWGLSVFFFTVLVGITGAIAYLGADDPSIEASTTTLVFFGSEITRLIIPLIALVLGWKAIAGERESGTIKVLLSLPHSRKDVVMGTFIGRALVLSLSLVIGFLAAGVVVALVLGQFDVVDYLGLLGLSIVYAVAYVSIAVAISALTKSTTVSGAGMIGVFVLFYVVWNALSSVFEMLAERGVLFFDTVSYTLTVEGPDGEMQEVEQERLQEGVLFFLNLDPGEAFGRALSMVTDVDLIQLQAVIEEQSFEGGVPFYLQDWFALLVLLAWIVVPIAVALYRFDRVDL